MMIYNSLASIRRAQSVAASAHRERKDLAAPPSPASICIAATVTQMAKKTFAVASSAGMPINSASSPV